jgi:hypothetical protein
MGEKKKLYGVLVGNPEGKRPLGRQRRRWKHGISMDLRKSGLERVEWIQLPQDRGRWQCLVNTAMNLRVKALKNSLVGWLVSLLKETAL